jgi:hypothetical protein
MTATVPTGRPFYADVIADIHMARDGEFDAGAIPLFTTGMRVTATKCRRGDDEVYRVDWASRQAHVPADRASLFLRAVRDADNNVVRPEDG